MKAKEMLNNAYAEKCQKLADLLLKKEGIEREIADVKRNIEILNAAVPYCEAVERHLQTEAQADKKDVKSPEVVRE